MSNRRRLGGVENGGLELVSQNSRWDRFTLAIATREECVKEAHARHADLNTQIYMAILLDLHLGSFSKDTI